MTQPDGDEPRQIGSSRRLVADERPLRGSMLKHADARDFSPGVVVDGRTRAEQTLEGRARRIARFLAKPDRNAIGVGGIAQMGEAKATESTIGRRVEIDG